MNDLAIMADDNCPSTRSPREQALQRPLNIDLFRTALTAEHGNETKLAKTLQESKIYMLERHGKAITGLYIQRLECSYEWGNKYKVTLKSYRGNSRWSPALTRRGSMLVVMDHDSEIRAQEDLEPAGAEAVPPLMHQATVIGGSSEHIEVLLNEPLPYNKVFVIQGTSDAPHTRMDAALHDIQIVNSHIAEMIVLGETKRPFQGDSSAIVPYNNGLDSSQQDAVKLAMKEAISIIHGPPGTGKTSTVIEIIRQFTKRGKRVLVCAASNAAVDNIIVRIMKFFLKGTILRLGHPGRIAIEARETSLEIKKGRTFGNKRKSRKMAKLMAVYVRDLLNKAQIVFGTLHASGAPVLENLPQPFDVVIIDEVSQATLAQAIVPISKDYGATQLVIAGDPKQLPPTILSCDPKVKQVLEVTLFDLLLSYHGHGISKLLDTQYRMSDAIMRFSAERMYGNLLKAANSVHNIDLHDLREVRQDLFLKAPIVFVDTKGTCLEEKDKKTKSTKNMGEAQIVYRYVQRLLQSGLSPNQIGVITPYGAQTTLVKQLLPSLDVSTVDGFQGQEREVIVMSMVRSNPSGTIGFLGDERRHNVAITRAKRHLCVIGDAKTLGSGGILREWTRHIREKHQVRCADTMFQSALDLEFGQIII